MADPTHGLVGRLRRACTPVAQGVYDTGLLLAAAEEAAEAIPALAAERARCVAHLRALADSVGDEEAIQVLLEAADDIECGEHVEEVAGG